MTKRALTNVTSEQLTAAQGGVDPTLLRDRMIDEIFDYREASGIPAGDDDQIQIDVFGDEGFPLWADPGTEAADITVGLRVEGHARYYRCVADAAADLASFFAEVSSEDVEVSR